MASGTYIYARQQLANGQINLAVDTVRALLYNTSSTIGTANPRGSSASASKGYADSGVDTVSDFTTLGEYLPGDSSSSDTTQTVALTSSFDETNNKVEYKASGAVSFGSLAAATLSAKGVLLFARTKKATATFTIGDTEYDDVNNATITLVDYAGKSLTYKIKNDYSASGTASNREFNAGGNATAAAANFKALVEHADNHNGTIAVTVDAGAVTMTQAVAGHQGNTTITVAANFDNVCDVNPPTGFTGGGSDSGSDSASLDIPIAAIEFPSPVNGNGSTFSVKFTDDNAAFQF
tara:strand:- start:2962 stop:3840 length:879 start_codon:yes stop_codon:yes gene_type:complete